MSFPSKQCWESIGVTCHVTCHSRVSSVGFRCALPNLQPLTCHSRVLLSGIHLHLSFPSSCIGNPLVLARVLGFAALYPTYNLSPVIPECFCRESIVVIPARLGFPPAREQQVKSTGITVNFTLSMVHSCLFTIPTFRQISNCQTSTEIDKKNGADRLPCLLQITSELYQNFNSDWFYGIVTVSGYVNCLLFGSPSFVVTTVTL